MNKVILTGRLTKNPEVKYSQDQTAIARYTLAVDRIKEGADFINCVAFTKAAEFAEKYFKKGTKIVLVGRIQTGSYKNKDGQTVYTTEVVVENQEFAESKKADGFGAINAPIEVEDGGWMNVPSGADEELPFMRPSR